MNKSNCVGCEDNFYNGNNQLGVKECWHLKTAKMILKKQVGYSQVPLWKQKPIKVPSCYQVKGYVFIEKNREY